MLYVYHIYICMSHVKKWTNHNCKYKLIFTKWTMPCNKHTDQKTALFSIPVITFPKVTKPPNHKIVLSFSAGRCIPAPKFCSDVKINNVMNITRWYEKVYYILRLSEESREGLPSCSKTGSSDQEKETGLRCLW